MFGVHGVIIGIVLNADDTTMADMFHTAIQEMVHADIELHELPIGARSQADTFQQIMFEIEI